MTFNNYIQDYIAILMKSVLFLIKGVLLCALPFFAFAQTADVTEGCLPLNVKFTPPAGYTTWYWDFDDNGAFSQLESPLQVFTKEGTYNVTFRETQNSSVIGTIVITVLKRPEISITAPSGCAPLTTTFTADVIKDPSITITKYTWFFGDGVILETTSPTTPHTYTVIKEYDISLQIETNYPTCNGTNLFDDFVEAVQPPVASFITSPVNLNSCNNNLNNVSFNNTSTGINPLTYSWVFGNGNTSSATNPPLQNYTGPGTFNISLTANYTGMTGCTSVANATVRLGKPNPEINQTDTKICANTATTFSTTTPGTYSWNFGADATPSTSTASSVAVSFANQGNHTVVLTVTSPDGLCTGTKLAQIYVDKVTADFTSTPSFTCESPSNVTYQATSSQPNVKYIWTFAHDGVVDSTTGSTIIKTYKSSTDSIYYSKNIYEPLAASLTVVSLATGCSASFAKLDTMWLPNARFAVNNYHGCAPLTVNFADSSSSFDKIVQWKWVYDHLGATQTNATEASTSHVYTTPGVYYPRLVVTTQKGCIDTSYAVKIEVGTNISALMDFTVSPNNICIGSSATLTSSINPSIVDSIDAYHFYADDENGRISHCGQNPNVTWLFNDTVGILPVTLVTDYNGCLSEVTKSNFITVRGAKARMAFESQCATPTIYDFESTTINGGAATLAWNFGDAATGSTASISHTYAVSGDYTVTLTAQADGCTNVDTRTVYVRQLDASYALPNPRYLCINTPYQFNASASDDVYTDCYSGYTWEFPTIPQMRPSNRPTATPSFSFPVAGVHDIKLVVKDINGCIDSVKNWVKIYDMAVNATLSDNQICNPTVVDFTDITTSDTTLVGWRWKFGEINPILDPGTLDNDRNISNNYNLVPFGGASSYTVTLEVEDRLGCKEANVFSIQHYAPTSSIQVKDRLGVFDNTFCLGDTAFISATDFTAGGSNLSYVWDFGNSTSSIVQSNKVLYANDQTYIVGLTFTEISSGCQGTTSASVSLQDYPDAKSLTTMGDGDTTVCGVQIGFKDASISVYPLTHYWDFGNGTNVTNPSYPYGPDYVRGTYIVNHTATTSYGCSDDADPITVELIDPAGTFNMTPTTICKGDSVLFSVNNDLVDVSSYYWSFGDGSDFEYNVSPVYHQYNAHPPGGVLPARLILEAPIPSCNSPIERTVNIHQVIANFNRETEILNQDTAKCMSELPYNFTNVSTGVTAGTDIALWTLGDTQTSNQFNVPAHTYSTDGVYSVKLFVQNAALGCKDSITKDIILNPNPAPVVTTDTVCLGDSLHLAVTNINATSSYAWSPATGMNSSTSTTPQVLINAPTIFTLVETDIATLCTGTDQIEGIVIRPIGLADFDTTIIVGDKVVLPAYKSGYYNFTWNPTEGLSCLDCNFPVIQPLENIVYNLEVTDDLGCFTSPYTFNIIVRPETFIKFPTLFTPNDDGSNDVIHVRGWGIKELLEFKIFNRWGQLVYESTNLEEGWDGKFNGAYQNTDVYAYKIKVKTWRETEIVDEGYFNLIR